ncbi:hypothetical protein D3C73_1261270 [compost metagenome]
MTLEVRRACHNDAGDLARLNLEFNGGELRETEDIVRSLNTGEELVAVAVLLEERGGECSDCFFGTGAEPGRCVYNPYPHR